MRPPPSALRNYPRADCALTVIVADASVLATRLGVTTRTATPPAARLRGELSAPELVDLEVRVGDTAGTRRHADYRRAALALADLALPFRRAQHPSLLARCWKLRNNLSIYDAAYVALAKALE